MDECVSGCAPWRFCKCFPSREAPGSVEQFDLDAFFEVFQEDVHKRLAAIALPMTDTVLISRDHEDDPRYAIEVHESVLRAHDFFERMLDGGYAENASHVSSPALGEASQSAEVPSGKRKLPDGFDAVEASRAAKARTRKDVQQDIEDSAASAAALHSQDAFIEAAQEPAPSATGTAAQLDGRNKACASPAAESSTSSAGTQSEKVSLGSRMGAALAEQALHGSENYPHGNVPSSAAITHRLDGESRAKAWLNSTHLLCSILEKHLSSAN
jgi:hypothetical protein